MGRRYYFCVSINIASINICVSISIVIMDRDRRVLVSWNVNGLRAAVGKGFESSMLALDADYICVQETKLQAPQVPQGLLAGYHSYWNHAEKPGYSGTAIFCREEPLSVRYGMGISDHDTEGRIICMETAAFFLVNVYTPNAQEELRRLDYRMQWEDDFRAYLKALESEGKPVVVCGDMNVAHKEIDLKNPKTNRRNPGFTDEERNKFTQLLDSGFTDTFRHFYPDSEECYSWWSYRFNSRAKNTGWRIDYFLTSASLNNSLCSAAIHSEIYGSDHCPVEVVIAV